MLEIRIDGKEFWNQEKEEFVNTKGITLRLEHSLISVSKWEAKYKRPFLSDGPKTLQEIYDYITFMSLDRNVSMTELEGITEEDYKKILDYIHDPMTATKITQNTKNKPKSNHVLTSEEIYYDMTALNIPFECEKWHLNRLITLIQIASIKNEPPKKMSKSEIYRQNAELNKARRAQHHSKG